MENFEGMTKPQARKAAAAIISTCNADYFLQAGQEICDTIASMRAYRSAGTVFCYVSTQKEPSTIPLLQKALADGKRLAVPKSEPNGILKIIAIDSLSQLRLGRFGIFEPMGGVELSLEDLDFSVIPCVAMSIRGERLGHGCGYYDRFLATCNHFHVVACVSKLLVCQLPVDVHDQPIRTIVTEKGILFPSIFTAHE